MRWEDGLTPPFRTLLAIFSFFIICTFILIL